MLVQLWLLLHDFQMGWAFRELMHTLSLHGHGLWNSNAKPEVCKSSGHDSKHDFGQFAYNYPVVPGRIKNKIHICQRGVKCCQMPHDIQQKFPLNSLELEFDSRFLSCKWVLVQFSAHSFSLEAAVSPSWTISQSMVNGFWLFISLLLTWLLFYFLNLLLHLQNKITWAADYDSRKKNNNLMTTVFIAVCVIQKQVSSQEPRLF